METKKELYRKLKQNGYRLTRQRLCVLDILLHSPQSVEKIHQRLIEKNIKIHKVTLYRILDLFAQFGFVGNTHLKGKTKHYELHSPLHHHHLVCNTCDTVEDVSLREDLLLKEVKRNTAFRIDSHHLEFFGVCAKCQ